MKKYVVRDGAGNLQIIGADGFVPDGSLGEAPFGASYDDGAAIEITDGKPVLNLEKQAAAKAAAAPTPDQIAAKLAKENAKSAAREKLKSVDWSQIKTAADIVPIIKALVDKD